MQKIFSRTRSPARGVRIASRLRAAPSAWDRIESFFPGAGGDRVRGVVFSLFERDARRARRRIEPVLDELNFHVTTDPALRAAIEKQLAARRGAKSTTRIPISFTGASPEFKRLLTR